MRKKVMEKALCAGNGDCIGIRQCSNSGPG